MSLCLIGLGSNEGDRQVMVVRALEELGRQPGIVVLRRSRLVQTAPIGGPPGQGLFLNAAAVLETSLDPDALLVALLRVENVLGRRRAEPWGPRTIDLDLLLYDDVVRSTPSLTLPHPRMAWRRFVLEPAAEVAGPMVHPTTGWTVARLLDHLKTVRDYVAITGPVAAGKTALAQRLVDSTHAHWISEAPDLSSSGAFCANSAGDAEAIELEFVNRRARLLVKESPVWREPTSLWVSDFWFDQSLAMARVWLRAEQWPAFRARWEDAAREVARPKLVVMLDASTDVLFERIAKLGRAIAACWTREALDRLGEAFDACLRRPDVGPVLRLTDSSPEEALRELAAAAEAMRL